MQGRGYPMGIWSAVAPEAETVRLPHDCTVIAARSGRAVKGESGTVSGIGSGIGPHRLRLVATGWRHGVSADSLAVRNTLFLLARPRGLEPLTF